MTNFIGIDVGTGSARAGIFNNSGQLLGTGVSQIATFRPLLDCAQQSSAEIWNAVCHAVSDALLEARVNRASISGIGFDATCSLVVSDENGAPVTVCPLGTPDSDVILWMDHRAIRDANEITAMGADVLSYVGGRISPEMEMPKLRWLKRELPESWAKAKRFWDLPDWLVHRATGTTTRSLCSPVCKWTYLGHAGTQGEGWDDAFLTQIGLDDLAHSDHAAIGSCFAEPGAPAGTLNGEAAMMLGLPPGIAVASGMIDAYAGALGTLGIEVDGNSEVAGRLALIAGTSTCHIALTQEPVFVSGIWGPYFSVLLPGLWANEGGQSAAGALIDEVVARHSASTGLDHATRIADQLNDHLGAMGRETATLTADRHVQPDFHGNRSPLADTSRKGTISGLTLDHGIDDLALDYLATVQALAYGTRHIIEEMRGNGMVIDSLVVSGGLARNPLYLREHADATGCRVIVPAQKEPVLLGAAMLGAVAAKAFSDLPQAMARISGAAEIILPRGAEIRTYHDAKYSVFRRMQADFAAYAELMQTAS
jgi:FGGY-family pentulose kinase